MIRNRKKITIIIIGAVALLYFLIPREIDFESYFPEIKNEILFSKTLDEEVNIKENIQELLSQNVLLDEDKKYAHLIQIGLAYKSLGDKENAREYLISAAENSPQKVTAFIQFGKIYARDGQLSVAERMYKKAVELEPESLYTQVSLLDFYLAYYSDRESLIQHAFDMARIATGEDQQVLLLYANWLEEREEYVRATDIYKLILNDDSRDPYNVQPKIEELFKLITGQ